MNIRKVTLGLCMLTLLSGCSNATEEALEWQMENSTGKETDIDISDNKMTLQSEDGTLVAGTEVPVDWPTDIPVIPNSKVDFAMSATDSENDGHNMMLGTKTSKKDVSAYYLEELQKSGWTMISNTMMGEMTAYGFHKDNRMLSLTVDEHEASTSIMLSVAKE